MILNQLNIIDGVDPELDTLKKIGNRIKTLRLKAGHMNYEKFANRIGVGRMLLRRAELGGNINLKNLLTIIKGLDVAFKKFFDEEFDE